MANPKASGSHHYPNYNNSAKNTKTEQKQNKPESHYFPVNKTLQGIIRKKHNVLVNQNCICYFLKNDKSS